MSAPIVILDGFAKLLDDVGTYFRNHGVKASVVSGWRERQKQPDPSKGGRVVFIPGDEDGTGGDIQHTSKQAGMSDVKDENGTLVGRVRSIRDAHDTFVVAVWALDATKPDDETAQVLAARELRRQVILAVNYSAQQRAKWGKTKWTNVPTELRAGAELRMWLDFENAIPDVPAEVAFPSAGLNPDPAK